jgi:hypothetical protein
VKRRFAILFSVLLFWTPSVFASGVLAGTAMTNCGCVNRHCCMSKSAPDNNPLPATPVRPLSLKQWQMVLTRTPRVLASAALPATEIPSTRICSPKPDAAPLYQRNCAWLI